MTTKDTDCRRKTSVGIVEVERRVWTQPTTPWSARASSPTTSMPFSTRSARCSGRRPGSSSRRRYRRTAHARAVAGVVTVGDPRTTAGNMIMRRAIDKVSRSDEFSAIGVRRRQDRVGSAAPCQWNSDRLRRGHPIHHAESVALCPSSVLTVLFACCFAAGSGREGPK
jgi:hypothetical protein